ILFPMQYELLSNTWCALGNGGGLMSAPRPPGRPCTAPPRAVPPPARTCVTCRMYERYQCQSQPTHNQWYIEMPETVTMLLAEVSALPAAPCRREPADGR